MSQHVIYINDKMGIVEELVTSQLHNIIVA